MSIASGASKQYELPSYEKLMEGFNQTWVMPVFEDVQLSAEAMQVNASFSCRIKEMPSYVEGESETMQKVRRIWTAPRAERMTADYSKAAFEARRDYKKEWIAMADNATYYEDIPVKKFPGKYKVIKKLLKSIHDYHAFEYDKEGNERPGWLLKCATFQFSSLITDDEEKQKKIQNVTRVAGMVMWSAAAVFFFVIVCI